MRRRRDFSLASCSRALIRVTRRAVFRRRRDLATSHGAVAQLGERYNGIVEVWGSIPHGSTTYFSLVYQCVSLVRKPAVSCGFGAEPSPCRGGETGYFAVFARSRPAVSVGPFREPLFLRVLREVSALQPSCEAEKAPLFAPGQCQGKPT